MSKITCFTDEQRLRVCVQNVPVCTGTTRTHVSTCVPVCRFNTSPYTSCCRWHPTHTPQPQPQPQPHTTTTTTTTQQRQRQRQRHRTNQPTASFASTRKKSPGSDTARIDWIDSSFFVFQCGVAWPFSQLVEWLVWLIPLTSETLACLIMSSMMIVWLLRWETVHEQTHNITITVFYFLKRDIWINLPLKLQFLFTRNYNWQYFCADGRVQVPMPPSLRRRSIELKVLLSREREWRLERASRVLSASVARLAPTRRPLPPSSSHFAMHRTAVSDQSLMSDKKKAHTSPHAQTQFWSWQCNYSKKRLLFYRLENSAKTTDIPTSGSVVKNHGWPERGRQLYAKRTTSYLLLFPGCPPVLVAIRRQHRHRAQQRSDELPHESRSDRPRKPKIKRGMAVEMRTTVCEIFLCGWRSSKIIGGHRSACTRTQFSGLRFRTSYENGIKIKEAHYWYSLPKTTRVATSAWDNDKGSLQKTHWRNSPLNRKVWLDNGGTQSAQRGRWNTEQSPVRCSCSRSCQIQSCPCKTKTSQQTEKSLLKFLGPSHNPEVI